MLVTSESSLFLRSSAKPAGASDAQKASSKAERRAPSFHQCVVDQKSGGSCRPSLSSTRTRSFLAPQSSPFPEASTSKGAWGLAALVVRGLPRRQSVADSPTVTFSSVHLHDEVAKKPDASTSLLQRLREHMILHSVDFIGGDFNMSAFSSVGDVFSDLEFAPPGNSLVAPQWFGRDLSRMRGLHHHAAAPAHKEGSVTRLLQI